jgi:hypothetical protein
MKNSNRRKTAQFTIVLPPAQSPPRSCTAIQHCLHGTCRIGPCGERNSSRARRRSRTIPACPLLPLKDCTRPNFYSTLDSSRNRCNPMKINDRVHFYSTINRGVFFLPPSSLWGGKAPHPLGQATAAPCLRPFSSSAAPILRHTRARPSHDAGLCCMMSARRSR